MLFNVSGFSHEFSTFTKQRRLSARSGINVTRFMVVTIIMAEKAVPPLLLDDSLKGFTVFHPAPDKSFHLHPVLLKNDDKCSCYCWTWDDWNYPDLHCWWGLIATFFALISFSFSVDVHSDANGLEQKREEFCYTSYLPASLSPLCLQTNGNAL